MSKKKNKQKAPISGKKVLNGLVLGGMIGTAVTLLSAPYSGKELRRKIKKETRENIQLVTDVKNDLSEVKKEGVVLQETAKELLPEFVNGTKKSVRAFQFRATPRIVDIRKQLEKIKLDLDNLTNL